MVSNEYGLGRIGYTTKMGWDGWKSMGDSGSKWVNTHLAIRDTHNSGWRRDMMFLSSFGCYGSSAM